MIIQLCRNCRIISNKLKNGQNIFIYKGLCYEKTILQKKPLLNLGTSQKRNFFGFLRKPSIEELRIKDKVPENYKLIYRNKMDYYLLLSQMITTTTVSLMGIMLIFAKGIHVNSAIVKNASFEENDAFIMLTVFIVSVVLLQVVLYKIPIRIYNFPQIKKYKVVFYGNIPLTHKTITCNAGELIDLPEGGTELLKNARYLLKSERTIYLFEYYFQRPADLHIMMGLQSDPDIEDNEKSGEL